MRRGWFCLIVCGLFLLPGCVSPTPEIRVMSFNIRYGTANDGENRWELRRDLVIDTIREFDPDLLGTQEVLAFQAEFLRDRLPDYKFIGAGRIDGKLEGEMTAIFYRRDRFEQLEAGHFWLSETPEIPGSRSWDSSLPRMVSWVRLRPSTVKGDTTQHDLVLFNTHFDHQGETARLESARLLQRTAREIAGDASIIITGDFNAPARFGEDEPYQALLGVHESMTRDLIDTFRQSHPESIDGEGTFGGFRGDTEGPRIDWILVSPHVAVLEAGIDRRQDHDRYPSDHYPVTAIVRLKAGIIETNSGASRF